MRRLWHVGRISDPSYYDGALPVAPSAIAPNGHVSRFQTHPTAIAARSIEKRARLMLEVTNTVVSV